MKISCFNQEKWIFSLKSNIDQVCFLDLVPTSTPLKFLKNWVFPFFSWVLWKYLSFVGKLGTEFFESRNWVFRFCSKNKPGIPRELSWCLSTKTKTALYLYQSSPFVFPIPRDIFFWARYIAVVSWRGGISGWGPSFAYTCKIYTYLIQRNWTKYKKLLFLFYE